MQREGEIGEEETGQKSVEVEHELVVMRRERE